MPNDSVFKPIDPQSLEGPFSGFLKPTATQQQSTQQGPPVMAGKGTSLGYLANKFIKGATEGRIKTFEEEENAKLQKFTAFQGYVSQIYQNPNLTEEAKQMALQKFSQVMGGYGVDAAGKSGGKGKGGGKDEGKEGVLPHVKNIARDLFQGMTGGKAPKGAPDVGSAMADLHAQLFDDKGMPKPQFNVQGIVANNQADIKRISDALPPGASFDQWMTAVTPHLQNLDRHAPDVGQQVRRDATSVYQPAPKYGTPEFYGRQWDQMHKPPGPPPNPGVDPNAPVNVRTAGGSAAATPGQPPSPPQGAPPAQGPPAAPQGHVFSPGEWGLLQTAGYADKPVNIEFTGPDGKSQKLLASRVTTPDGKITGYFDQSGREIIAKDVRLASTAEPKAERFSTAQVVRGNPKLYPNTDPKKWYKVQQSEDDPKNFHVIGESADPTARRGGSAFNPDAHPQVMIAKRKLAALEGLSKVMQQTPVPKKKDAKGAETGEDISGAELAQWYKSHIQKFYAGDKSVNQYLPDINALLDTMEKAETFKGKQDAIKMMEQATGQAKQEATAAHGTAQMDHIQEQHDELVNEMLGGSGGGVSLNDLDR